MVDESVLLSWEEKTKFKSIGPGGELYIDMGKAYGGDSSGLSPKALMLSALAGCSALDIVSILKKMRVEFYDFKIKVDAVLTREHPKYYKLVRITYGFYGVDLKKDNIEKAVNLSIDKYCGVMAMFKKFAKIDTQIVYNTELNR